MTFHLNSSRIRLMVSLQRGGHELKEKRCETMLNISTLFTGYVYWIFFSHSKILLAHYCPLGRPSWAWAGPSSGSALLVCWYWQINSRLYRRIYIICAYFHEFKLLPIEDVDLKSCHQMRFLLFRLSLNLFHGTHFSFFQS